MHRFLIAAIATLGAPALAQAPAVTRHLAMHVNDRDGADTLIPALGIEGPQPLLLSRHQGTRP